MFQKEELMPEGFQEKKKGGGGKGERGERVLERGRTQKGGEHMNWRKNPESVGEDPRAQSYMETSVKGCPESLTHSSQDW